MFEGKRNVMRGVTLAALICGLTACSESSSEPGDGPSLPKPEDPVEEAAQALGAEIAGCSPDDNGFDMGTLTFTLDDEAIVLSAPAGKITANGELCKATISSATTQLTTTNVTKINLKGSSDPNKVILDMLPGSFGTKILSNTGGIAVDFATDAGGADQFMIRGGTGPETYKIGKVASGEIYIELTGDKAADVQIKPGAMFSFAASMGGGADTVTGAPAAADIMTFQGAGVTIVPMTSNMTVYGGLANDTLTGGDGDDTLYGGAGNDTFKTGAADDGSDVYVGDADSDTVDYSARTNDLKVDIGPTRVGFTGDVNLATLNYATGGPLNTLTIIVEVDNSGMDRTVTLANPTSPANLVAQINGTTGLTNTASLVGSNFLRIQSTTNTTTSQVELKASTALTMLGLATGVADPISMTANVADGDDGETGENDDVRTTTENIIGGKGNDILFGDADKNSIKGGDGNDTISGGSNSTCTVLTDGDTLQGEAGNDVFYAPVANNCASYSGGTGDNTVDYSGRLAIVTLTNNGTANDGESIATSSATDEKGNIAADILKMVGGWGNDSLTGGMGNDTLVGGSGADLLNGGAGIDDTVDYSGYGTTATTVTLCFTAAVADCGSPGNDGRMNEMDQVWNVEHLKGAGGVDTYSVMPAAAVDVTFEGGAGADVLTGGDGNDTIWGDADGDTIKGGIGDDTLNGGDGTDSIDGEGGDGDICVAGETISNCEI